MGVRKHEVFATYVGNEESLGDSEGPDGIRTRYLPVKSRLPVRIGSGPADWRNRIRTCGLADVSGASTPLDCPPLRDQESNLDLGDMNPAGYRYPIPQLATKRTRLQVVAPARI